MSNFPACVEDDVVITIDTRLAYRDDMTSEWTTKFHSVEQRPLRCTFAVSKVNLHDFMLYTEMRNSYTFLCLVRKNPVFFSDVWKRRALLSLWPNTIHGAGKCSPQIFFNEPAFASEWHNERWHRGNKGHPCSGEYNFYMLTSVIRHVVFELISKAKNLALWHLMSLLFLRASTRMEASPKCGSAWRLCSVPGYQWLQFGTGTGFGSWRDLRSFWKSMFWLACMWKERLRVTF